MSLKVAVATTNGHEISPHIGHSPVFAVYEIRDGAVQGRELRENPYHDPRFHAHDGAVGENLPDPHRGLLEVIGDTGVLLTCGHACMAAQTLLASGIHVLTLSAPCTADEAIQAFMDYVRARARRDTPPPTDEATDQS